MRKMANSSAKIWEVSTPPKSVDLSQTKGARDGVVLIILSGLAVLVVLLRLSIRIFLGNRPKLDDWVMALSLPLLISLLILTFVVIHLGLGKHVWVASIGGLLTMKKLLFSSLIIYNLELGIIKMSVLLFYRRAFGMTAGNWVAMCMVAGWTIGSIVAVLTATNPISFFWAQGLTAISGHDRYDFYNYYIANAATNVFCDIAILLVPIPVVWGLEARVMQKVVISLVLCLGSFAIAASVVRIHYLTRLKGEGLVDITWNMEPVCLWSAIEPCMSIVWASLPTMPPIARRALRWEYIGRRQFEKHENGELIRIAMENQLPGFFDIQVTRTLEMTRESDENYVGPVVSTLCHVTSAS